MKSFLQNLNICIALIAIMVFIQCKSTKSIDCQGDSKALVVDMKMVDNCADILLLSNGDKIQPIYPKDQAELVKSKMIRFNFTKTKSLPTCSAADYVAEISCITYDEQRNDSACSGESNVGKISWLKSKLNSPNLLVVYSVKVEGQYFYQLDFHKKVELYSCRGHLVCQSFKNKPSNCLDNLLKGNKKNPIFTNEGRPH